MRRGLVLEGGGAKGAYHVGAVKALYDNGYTFDGVAGTSIGAINGAMIAQDGGVETCFDMWTNIKFADIIDTENNEAAKLFSTQSDKPSIKFWIEKTFAIIKNLGVPTDRIIPFLKRYIDEDKLRAAGRDFAIVTFCISDKKPLELHLEDIPYGEVCDFVFASAYYPVFKLNRINGKYYLDGGVYDNLPVNALIRRGNYDEIIAVRTGHKKTRPLIDSSVVVKTIEPTESLGKTTGLDKNKIAYNIKLGYYDALRMIHDYKGIRYYFDKTEYSYVSGFLYNLPEKTLKKLISYFKLRQMARKDEIVDAVYLALRKGKLTMSDERNFLTFLEGYALKLGLDKFVIYTFDEFIAKLKQLAIEKNFVSETANGSRETRLDRLFEIIIREDV